MSMFAEATKKAATARFKQPQLDSQGQEIEVRLRNGLKWAEPPELVLFL